MIKEILSKVGVKQAKIGRKYRLHRTMIGKVLNKSKVGWIKQTSAPKYYPGHKERAKKAAGILGRDFFTPTGSTDIVIDDESYFGLKDDITPGNDGFYKKSVTPAGDLPELKLDLGPGLSILRSSLYGEQFLKRGSVNHMYSLKSLADRKYVLGGLFKTTPRTFP